MKEALSKFRISEKQPYFVKHLLILAMQKFVDIVPTSNCKRFAIPAEATSSYVAIE